MTAFALLAVLAWFDGTLCGFRAAAGTNPRIFIGGFYRRALVRGALFSVVTLLVFSGVAVALHAVLPPEGWRDVEQAAGRLVVVYGAFATLVIFALALYLVGHFDLGVLASVLVLGPFTLARPWVIALGAGWVAATAHSWVPGALALSTAAVMINFERLLDLGQPPWRGLEGDRKVMVRA